VKYATASLCTLVVLLAAGCNTTNRQTFDETAALFHDDLRWGRIPVAEAQVDPSIREAFVQHHRTWGAVVHVMDIEVEALRASSTRSTARLRVVWTRGTDSTDVRESVVEETWENTAGRWRLHNEAVIAGDAGLFGTPSTAPAARADDVSTPQG
jgi:hypothetical protein